MVGALLNYPKNTNISITIKYPYIGTYDGEKIGLEVTIDSVLFSGINIYDGANPYNRGAIFQIAKHPDYGVMMSGNLIETNAISASESGIRDCVITSEQVETGLLDNQGQITYNTILKIKA